MNHSPDTPNLGDASKTRKTARPVIGLEKVFGTCRKDRRGAAVVEFAVIAPVFILLVFGMIEYGRMVMVQQILTNAAREGARKAVLDGISTSDVQSAVVTYMNNAGIGNFVTSDVAVTSNPAVPPDVSGSKSVSAGIDFDRISWLPSPMYLGGKTLTATATMRLETVN